MVGSPRQQIDDMIAESTLASLLPPAAAAAAAAAAASRLLAPCQAPRRCTPRSTTARRSLTRSLTHSLVVAAVATHATSKSPAAIVSIEATRIVEAGRLNQSQPIFDRRDGKPSKPSSACPAASAISFATAKVGSTASCYCEPGPSRPTLEYQSDGGGGVLLLSMRRELPSSSSDPLGLAMCISISIHFNLSRPPKRVG
ncbi:hypothetical protein ON010_g16710 [Phytophthora cinnamomi]|nr:hypothetical protein ON010_g16710 [Phytophthora cinnamomi]